MPAVLRRSFYADADGLTVHLGRLPTRDYARGLAARFDALEIAREFVSHVEAALARCKVPA